MNLEEMKLAVAKMLPNEIDCTECGTGNIHWRDSDDPVMDREWLHVCWLAEGTLTKEERRAYNDELNHGTAPGFTLWYISPEVKIEALCRVRCPEMFTESP